LTAFPPATLSRDIGHANKSGVGHEQVPEGVENTYCSGNPNRIGS